MILFGVATTSLRCGELLGKLAWPFMTVMLKRDDGDNEDRTAAYHFDEHFLILHLCLAMQIN